MNAIEIHAEDPKDAWALGVALGQALRKAGVDVEVMSAWGQAASEGDDGARAMALGGDPARIETMARGLWMVARRMGREGARIECPGALGMFHGSEAALAAAFDGRASAQAHGALSVLDVAVGPASQWSPSFGRAVDERAPDAVVAPGVGPEAVALAMAAFGVEPALAGLEAPARAAQEEDFELHIDSLGPGGYGSAKAVVFAPSGALAAWEVSRGRSPGEGAKQFARLVWKACEKRGWGPQALSAAEPPGRLRLAPMPGDGASPSQVEGGRMELAKAVEEAASSIGVRPKVVRV